MVWGTYVQHGDFELIDELGSKLSLAIKCDVHYPAYNKPMFECKCGICFSKFVVEGRNWEMMRKYHEDIRRQLCG